MVKTTMLIDAVAQGIHALLMPLRRELLIDAIVLTSLLAEVEAQSSHPVTQIIPCKLHLFVPPFNKATT